MVRGINCECADRFETKIDSFKLFEEIIIFFQEQVNKKIFDDFSDYSKIWYLDGGSERNIYRTTLKHYKCRACGCLWEFVYPEFPAYGFVRKFEDGKYHTE